VIDPNTRAPQPARVLRLLTLCSLAGLILMSGPPPCLFTAGTQVGQTMLSAKTSRHRDFINAPAYAHTGRWLDKSVEEYLKTVGAA
jgi:hypothetical protein